MSINIPPLYFVWFARPTSLYNGGIFWYSVYRYLHLLVSPALLGDLYCFINSVAVDGVKYKVTRIAANAFKGTKATKITVGANVKTISKNAFKGSKAKTIVLKNRKVSVKKGAFSGRNTKKMTIKVKCSKKQLAAVKKALKKAGFNGKVTRL